RFFDPAALRWLDFAAVGVHWSYFATPHAVAVLVFWKQRALFPRYAVFSVGIMYASLLVFFLVPTAPPWLAAIEGRIAEAPRIMHLVGNDLAPGLYDTSYDGLG